MQRIYKYAPLAKVELTDEEVQLLVAFWTKNKDATQSDEVDKLIGGGQIYASDLQAIRDKTKLSQRRALRNRFSSFIDGKKVIEANAEQRLHSESNLWELLVMEAKKAGINDLSQIVKANKKDKKKKYASILKCIEENTEYTPTERAQLKDFLTVLFNPYIRIDDRIPDFPKSILDVLNISKEDLISILQTPGKLSDEQIEVIMRRNPLDFYELVAPIIGMERVRKIEGRDIRGQYPAFDFFMSDFTSEITDLVNHLKECVKELLKESEEETKVDYSLTLEKIESIDKTLKALENDDSINFSDLLKISPKPDTNKLLHLAQQYVNNKQKQYNLASKIFNPNTVSPERIMYIARFLKLLIQIASSEMPNKKILECSFYPFLSESDLELIKIVNPWFYCNYLVVKSIPEDEIIKEPTMIDLARYKSLMRLFPVMDKRKAPGVFVQKGSINSLARDYLEIALNRSKLKFSNQNTSAILNSVEQGITYNVASSVDASAATGKKNTSDTINYLKGLQQDVTGLVNNSDVMKIIDACLRDSQTPDFKRIPYQSKISGVEKYEAAREIFDLIESPFMRCVYTMYLGYNKEHMKFSIEEIAHFWQVQVSTIVTQMNAVAARIPDSNIKALFSPVCLGIAVPEGIDLHNPKGILKFRVLKYPEQVCKEVANKHSDVVKIQEVTYLVSMILELSYSNEKCIDYLPDDLCITLANEMLEELCKQRNNNPVNPTKRNHRLAPLPDKQN